MLKKINEIQIDDIAKGRFYFLGVFYNRIFWTNHEIVFIYDSQIRELFKGNKIRKHLVIADKYLYIEDDDIKVERIILDLETLQIKKIDIDVEVYSGTTDFLLGIELGTRLTISLDTRKFKQQWKLEGFVFFTHYKNFTFSRDSEMLALYNNETGNEIWNVKDFSAFNYETKDFIDEPPEQHKATIHRIIGVYDSVVWITLNSGRLLGYSMTDGKLLYNITLPNYYYDGFNPTNFHQSFFFGSYSQLDEQKGMLFGLLRDNYWEIDLNDPENAFILYSLKESSKRFDIIADGVVFQPYTNNEIFFNMLYPKTNALGVFDRRLKEIVWAAPVERSRRGYPSIRQMAYSNDRLYLLSDNSKFIIYEKKAE